MDLKCKLPYLFGAQVLVNGTSYPVSEEGMVSNVKAEDAKKLLANSEGFCELRTPVRAVAEPKVKELPPEPPSDSSAAPAAEEPDDSVTRRPVRPGKR